MKAFRAALGDDTLPIVVGGLGDFLKDMPDSPRPNYVFVNEALERFANETPNTVYASAKGLTSNPDFLHFNHHSLQEFGLRYYAAFKTVENKDRIFEDENKLDDSRRSSMELL